MGYSKRNVVGYYSNSLKIKGSKYHTLGEFCQTGYYDSIIVGSLFWNQNLTEFHFDCEDFESINQDKIIQNSSEDPDSEKTSEFKKYDFSKIPKVSKENNTPTKASAKINIEKNTILTNKCVDLRNDIEICQNLGVKILVSIGGRHGTISNTTIPSAEFAQKLAVKIWDMFLFGDNGRKIYKEQQLLILKKEEEKIKRQLEAEEKGDFSSSSSDSNIDIDDFDYFEDESLSKDESDSSNSEDDYLIDEDEFSDSYYDEYSDDDGTIPPVYDDEDQSYVDEEAYSDSDYYASDQYDSSGNKLTRKPRVFSSKKKTIKKKAPVFTPRPFGYDIFLNGVDLSPLVGRSDNYLHLALALDSYRIPRRDIFLISATLDCSVLHSKKENVKVENSILKFNFDFLNLDFVHNKQCDYWSKISDQTIIDWSTYTVKNKYNQTKIILQVSSNTKDSAYFSPKFFLMEYTQYCYDLPNMAGAFITDVLSASKIINSTTKIDFTNELTTDLRNFEPSTRRFIGTRPPSTYANSTVTRPLKTKEPVLKVPVTHSPIKLNSTKTTTNKNITTTKSTTKKPIDIDNVIISDSSTTSGINPIILDSDDSNVIVFDDSDSSSGKPATTKKPSTTIKKPIITKSTHKPIKSDSSFDTNTIILDSGSSNSKNNNNNDDVIIFDDSGNSKDTNKPTNKPTSKPTNKPLTTKTPTKKPASTKAPPPTATPKLRPTHKPISSNPIDDVNVLSEQKETIKPTIKPTSKPTSAPTNKPLPTKAPTKKPASTKAPPPTATPKLRPTHKPINSDPSNEISLQPTEILNEQTNVPIPSEKPTTKPTTITSKEPTETHKPTIIEAQITSANSIETTNLVDPNLINDHSNKKTIDPIFIETQQNSNNENMDLRATHQTISNNIPDETNQQDQQEQQEQPDKDINIQPKENDPIFIEQQNQQDQNKEPLADEAVSRRAGRHKPISAKEFDKNFFS
ncbi:hypothetical protein DICPUDRAFT_150029 [Dictyostelium purpureum]|uniref:Uncharacterized protein n=1 Tax=Dictyostelium purpureum TaxID=5786 RepID=F0ZFA0_DICPU|nr:uncharacterized protein DICPUDRAFT_150029 [Dictyostelium purpureum]EGC37348.1 hypothetical protein DICPUDRAFT_150029 [Dictyostelium purpureum]|eukprot:XP_003286089.1 hypothetical protein DICPUDRAFT_150029 [Dictyostelium purpureum]